LCDDQEAVEDGPENASRLVGNGRIAMKKKNASVGTRNDRLRGVRNIIATGVRRVVARERVRAIGVVLVGVESLNVLDECHDTTREDKDK
jgi:hypothetical protein